MYFDGAYRLIGTTDVTALAAAIDAVGVMTWLEDISRQTQFEAHARTQSIPLIYDIDKRHTDPTVLPRFDEWKPLLSPIMELIAAYYAPRETVGNPGYFIRIILVNLGAGHSIPPHADSGDSLSRAHRIHMAVKTNARAEFSVDGVTRNLVAGEIWEINNRKVHAVANHGEDNRVHLILDYVVPGEIVADPKGTLVS